MVLGGPRSGTTWAANLLTTDTTVCLHDPLVEYTLVQLSSLFVPGAKIGISCTAALMFPEWVNAQKCPKIILYREVADINNSLRQLGLVELERDKHMARIDAIKGAKLVPYQELFGMKTAQGIANYLGVPFYPARHDILRQMHVEPLFRHINMGKQAVHDLFARIRETL